MKKFLLPIFVFIFFFSFTTLLYAQSADNADPSTFEDINNFYTTVDSPAEIADPKIPEDPQNIDDVVETVTVNFPDLPPAANGKMIVCLKSSLCIDNNLIREAIMNATPDSFDKISQFGLPKGTLRINEFEKNQLADGATSITVCAKNENDLKTDCVDKEKNYFWPGKSYHVTLYEQTGENFILRRRAAFYVNHHSPIVEVVGINKKAPEKFKVTLYQDALTKKGEEKDNNFQIVINGAGGYKQERCLPQDDGSFRKTTKDNPYSLVFPYQTDGQLFKGGLYSLKGGAQNGDGLTYGKYIVQVNEQISEGRQYRGLGSNNCTGGFTYLRFECFVPPVDNKDNKTTTCKKIEDPNGSDLKNLIALLDEISGDKQSILPCKEGMASPGIQNCKEIDTAIGPIKLDTVGFITRLFQIVLAIASLGAFALIIYAGYKLLISRGNKEIIQGARETLTAAILGLLFIIFSLVILSVITGGILRLPGFN